MPERRAVFLDRDGVINVNRKDHVKSWEEFVFLPRALDALRMLATTDFFAVVTTNQAAINRKQVDEATVRDIHTRMWEAVERAGGCLHAIYYCPHRPDENCDCRKPQPGMYLRGARDFNVDLERSYVIGDARSDVEAARAIGAQPIFVLSGRGCDRCNGNGCDGCPKDCLILKDLFEAVEWILRKEQGTE